MAAPALIQSLSWRASSGIEINKQGIPQYDGSVIDYEEWKFRVMARWESYGGKAEDHRDQDRKELAAKVLEGLSGDAMNIAKEMPMPDIITAEGIPTLVERIKSAIAGKRISEAKELYREGVKKHGELTRQRGEPMSSYVIRRSR